MNRASGATTGQLGVYLAAAELTRLGLIASVTSRNAKGADILVTDQECKKTWSIQVKTNAKTFSFWLLSAASHTMRSDTYLYILINLRKDRTELFLVPSKVIAEKMVSEDQGKSTWHSFSYDNASKCHDLKKASPLSEVGRERNLGIWV